MCCRCWRCRPEEDVLEKRACEFSKRVYAPHFLSETVPRGQGVELWDVEELRSVVFSPVGETAEGRKDLLDLVHGVHTVFADRAALGNVGEEADPDDGAAVRGTHEGLGLTDGTVDEGVVQLSRIGALPLAEGSGGILEPVERDGDLAVDLRDRYALGDELLVPPDHSLHVHEAREGAELRLAGVL